MNRLLIRACEEKFPVEIIYCNKDNVFSKRTISVRAINDSYIKAFCLIKKQTRIFRVESILAVALLKQKGDRYYA
ncbi:WYL domain-containing protein [Cytobacillus depressus]|uniref:WYL domain-containing protein n=1 Tax=Cytobacillus depressus TaxID=1602942 RepID=A0A6L3V9T3_9BACI|nr:WYL domain-containing protein [Cytobacillus depressus]KAB2337668.1 WYL domain-containing protein [Cytobacillus depressus]